MPAAVVPLPTPRTTPAAARAPHNPAEPATAHPGKITSLAHARAIQQRPITDACRWLDAWQIVAEANVRAAFVLQRMALRALLGH